MMKQLTASVTAQDAIFADLSTKTNSGGGSSRAGKNTDNKKSQPGLHVCTHCKREVYHKEGNYLELMSNKAKLYDGWKRFLE